MVERARGGRESKTGKSEPFWAASSLPCQHDRFTAYARPHHSIPEGKYPEAGHTSMACALVGRKVPNDGKNQKRDKVKIRIDAFSE